MVAKQNTPVVDRNDARLSNIMTARFDALSEHCFAVLLKLGDSPKDARERGAVCAGFLIHHFTDASMAERAANRALPESKTVH